MIPWTVKIMNKIRSLVAIGLFVALAACAAHPDPIIDMKGVNPDQLAKDWADCEGYSEQVIVGKGVAKGAGVGGVVGAAGGAIHDDVGRGAASGALIGATRSGLKADRDKQQVFKRCLRGRGYKVLN